jgi:RNA recognition motif-containing protein
VSTGTGPPPERKSKNTAVFVRLPFDATFDEVAERFSKCGLIEEDDDGEPKVKMYARDDGTFSGEALVVYFKEESVSLAINILDDAEFRLGDPSSRMSVQRAEFGHKSGNTGGEAKKRVVDRKKVTKRLGKMQKYVPCSTYLVAPDVALGSWKNGWTKIILAPPSQKRMCRFLSTQIAGWLCSSTCSPYGSWMKTRRYSWT